jgi:hypothetical protein
LSPVIYGTSFLLYKEIRKCLVVNCIRKLFLFLDFLHFLILSTFFHSFLTVYEELEHAPCTVTRLYEVFRHPDRMAPESSVMEVENDCFTWSGNLPTKVPYVFPTFFQNPEFSGDFHGHRPRKSLALAGIFHSSMAEEISGIFRRISCEKTEVCAQGGIDLWSSDNYSTPFPLDHGYLL